MRREDLEELADRVGEGREVDWSAAEAIADDDEQRGLVHQLRLVAEVARVHQTDGLLPSAARAPLERWAHLEIRQRLASGSYGQVYRAWDPRLEREVALKLLRCEMNDPNARDIIGGSDVIYEARQLARVRHPNVITVYGADRLEGCVGLWMELVEGQTLDAIVDTTGPLSPAEAVLVGLTLCRALSAVHRAGLLHRDIKPQNVMRERGGRLVLMDFGSVREDAAAEPSHAGPEPIGTPLFMAPEVARGAPASAASDVYSVGALLFYALTGTYVVEGRSLEEVRAAHAAGKRRTLGDLRPDVPEPLVSVIARATAPDPANRYATPGLMAEALAGALAFRSPGPRTVTRRRWPAAVAIAATLLAAAGIGWWLMGSPAPAEPFFRQLTYRQGRVLSGRFAPDGRTVVYSAEWSGQPRELFISAFDSVESRAVGLTDASILSVSTKGELAVLLRPRFLRGYVESGTLARLPVGGGVPRELLVDVQEADWSPDGTTLALVRAVQGTSTLEFPAGKTLYSTGGWVSHIRVSPDGTRVAFIDHPTPADDSGSIAVVTLGGSKQTLTDGWASAQGLAWAPSGQEVWFTASRAGNTRALHAVDLNGRTRLVHAGTGRLRIQDISSEGRVLLTSESTRVGVMARAAGEEQERELSWLDWSIARDVSDDGRMLLMNESGEGGGQHYSIYVRSLDGAPAVRLSDGSGMAISPDGRSVLATRPAAAGPPSGLLIVPIGAGEIQPLPRGTNRYQQWGTWFPDGKRVLFAGNEPGRGSRLYVQPLDGKPVPITPEGVYLGSSQPLSPDARMVAAIGPDDVPAVFPVAGGPPRAIPGAVAGEVPVHWAADGTLYLWHRGQAPAQVFKVDVASGRRVLWTALMPADPTGVHEILRIAMSRDASAYAYSYTRELSSLHVAENVR